MGSFAGAAQRCEARDVSRAPLGPAETAGPGVITVCELNQLSVINDMHATELWFRTRFLLRRGACAMRRKPGAPAEEQAASGQ